MADQSLSKPLDVIATEGKVVVEGPGVAATLDVNAATLLSDQLLAASKEARQADDQAQNSGPSSSE